MKQVIVPTDFSENANNAMEYALALAQACHAKVTILNTYTPAVTHFEMVSPLIADEIETAKKTAQNKLAAIGQVIDSQYPEVKYTTQFTTGGLVSTLEELAKQGKADLIVVGTQGATGLDKVLFGSNAAKIIERVPCAVMAIPKDCPFKAPQRIAYATDFNTTELLKIDQLITVARAFDAEIAMVHITTEEEALVSEEMLKRYFAQKIARLTHYENITYHLKYEENIQRGLASFLQQTNTDLIALLTHERSLFEKFYNPSLAKFMAYHTDIPLLAIKA